MGAYQKYVLWVLLIIGALLLTGCGTKPPDIQTMMQNLSRSYPNIWKLITASAYVLGFLLAFKAVYTLKIYGDMRTMMSSNASIKTPIIYFIVSASLIYMPTMFHIMMYTTYGYESPLKYSGSTLPGWSDASSAALLGLIQIIGLIAFLRGWLQIVRSAEQSSQPGGMAKGITHMMGGLLAINIVGTRDIIWNTLGF